MFCTTLYEQKEIMLNAATHKDKNNNENIMKRLIIWLEVNCL